MKLENNIYKNQALMPEIIEDPPEQKPKLTLEF